MELQQPTNRSFPKKDWKKSASCRDKTGQLLSAFFVTGDPKKIDFKLKEKRAKQICNGSGVDSPCPVREECLAFALDLDIRDGIFGGLNEDERRRFRNRLKKRKELESYTGYWLCK